MEIFEREIADGLCEKLQSATFIFSSLLYPAKSDYEIFKWPKTIIATNLNQPDLYYLNTILATTGWNNNDDVFGQDETWKARHSPEDKRINLNHNERDIIGHITGNFVVDDKWNIIEDAAESDGLPDKFHIVTNAVVYRKWEDPEFQKQMNAMIEEIEAGKWYVSMECLAKGFDYALVAENGEQSVVKRNKDTAHLTKYLKVMGGEGVYKNRKIGRYLRNIVFSGKGFTQKPANPESIVINEASMQIFAAASINGEDEMADKTPETTLVRTEPSISLKDHEDKLDALKAELKTLNDKVVAEKIGALEKVVKAKEDELKDVSDKLKVSAAKVDEFEKKVTALAEENTKISAKVKELEGEKRTVSRVATLVKAGKTEDEAKKLVLDKFSALDDSAFDGVATLFAEASAAIKAAAVKTEEKPEDDKTGEVNANAAELTNKEKPKEEVVVVTAEEDKKLASELGDYFSNLFGVKATENE